MPRWLATVLFLVLAPSAQAQAQGRARLIVRGDSCALDQLATHVTALLGRDPFALEARAVVRVEIRQASEGVAAEVTLVDASGVRTGPRSLAAADCDQLAAELPIVIATVMRSLPEPVPPVAQEIDVDHVEETATRQPRPRAGTSLAILAGVSLGERTEEVAGVRVRRGRGSLLLQARRANAEEVVVMPGASSIAVAQAALDLVPCAHASVVFACGLVSAGWLSGTSHGLVHVDRARLPLVAAGARIGAEYHLTDHIGFAVRTELRVLVTGAAFQVDRMTVWTSPGLEVAAGIDVFAQIP